MSELYDPLPVAWGLAVPEPICEALLDLGLACNDAALLLDTAQLEHRRSLNGASLAEACGRKAHHRGYLANQLLECTLTYTDQLTAAYTAVACTLAAYAAAVAVALIHGEELPVPDLEPMRPSQVLALPDVYLPLVQMHVDTRRDHALVAHNTDLIGHHGRVHEIVDAITRSDPVDAYDEPSRLANRPVRSVEQHLILARALHCYGSGCAWAVALSTRV